MENPLRRIDTIFIDADDTLWDNEDWFRAAEAKFAALLAPHAKVEDVQQVLWARQEENIPLFGYGSKTYFIGMVDVAIELCGGSLPEGIYHEIKKIITELAFHQLHIYDGVEAALAELSSRHRLILATKGDANEQLDKLERSGLSRYFFTAEVMKQKDEEDYLVLCRKYGVKPEDFVMVGNSVRSDIIPPLNIGGHAVFIPHEIVWTHELADKPESERLIEIADFAELTSIL